MGGSIKFYTYGSTLELNGQQFDAGVLTTDLLNLSPEAYWPLHEQLTRICSQADAYTQSRERKLWWELNLEMQSLCQRLRRYTVFRLLLDQREDEYFSLVNEITAQTSLFPAEERPALSDAQKEATIAAGREFIKLNEVDALSAPDLLPANPCLTLADLGNPGGDDKLRTDWLRICGVSDDNWNTYRAQIERYRVYLHDVRAFNGTIRNFISFSVSKLKTNCPESYAEALYGFYNDTRIAEKLIVNPSANHGDCYTRRDAYMLSYVPRELPDGSAAICQEHETDSLQALMKADYMLALNCGYNIRRCVICGKYFLLRSGVHALYCESACPHAPGYTCRQFGAVEVQKELAKNVPKIQAKLTAFARITKDMQRGAITPADARIAKDYVRDRLYEALRSANCSVEQFTQQISSKCVYQSCGITRVAKPRGRPSKAKSEDTP